MDPLNILAKFELRSFRRSWNNRGIFLKIGKSLDTPTLPFLQILKRILFEWTLWIYLPNLKFVVLPVGEIIGCTEKKFGQSLDTPTFPFLPNFKNPFARINPVNIPAKFEVRSFTRSWDNRGAEQITWWRHLWRHKAWIDYRCGWFIRTVP